MRLKVLYYRNNKKIIFIIFCITCYIFFTFKLKNIHKCVPKTQFQLRKEYPCEIRHLNPFDEEIPDICYNSVPTIECEGEDWVKCYQSECKVIREKFINLRNLTCIYNDIIYESDQGYHLGPDYVVSNDETYILNNSDHVKVSCKATSKNLRTLEWKGYAAGLRKLAENVSGTPFRKGSYNVLIFGYETTTKNGFIRRMQESYKYLTQVMHGTVLNGYSIVMGSNLFPILTGKSEEELPDVKASISNTNSLDLLPFIFYKLHKDGYRTAYFKDMDRFKKFNGFERQPTHHYLKAFYMEENTGNWFGRIKNIHCLGDTPQFKFMMNITDQFLHLNGKKFVFTCLSDITSENFNLISATDGDLTNLLKSLVNTGVLEDTLVIIMGTHGVGYTDFHNTFRGKLEDQVPFMCIVLPEQLKRLRPDAQSALEANAEALTTPHDIHATILDVLDMQYHMNRYQVLGAKLPRGMSLLESIPKNRTCIDGDIDPHWCPCLVWKNLSHIDHMYNKSTAAFVDYLNLMTEPVRHLCELLVITEVKWVMQQQSDTRTSALKELHREKSLHNGSNIQYMSENYHLKIMLGPGDAVFETSMEYIVEEGRFIFGHSDITRIDDYALQLSCKEKLYNLQHLIPYCFCSV